MYNIQSNLYIIIFYIIPQTTCAAQLKKQNHSFLIMQHNDYGKELVTIKELFRNNFTVCQ